MPTHHKAQLTETSMPFLEVWELMRSGLMPVARRVLELLKFYEERDLKLPSNDEPLSDEEEAELGPIITCLTRAAVRSEQMKPGPLVSTLARLQKRPELYHSVALPAAVLWELAQDYQRGSEPPGTFSLDIWGSDQSAASYDRVEPSDGAIAQAAARARARTQQAQSPGRPYHPAHQKLAGGLAEAFGKSELEISRSRRIIDSEGRVRNFATFLEMVLPPLRAFLCERRLPPLTTGSILLDAQAYVRESLAAHPPSTPDCSDGWDDDIFGDDP